MNQGILITFIVWTGIFFFLLPSTALAEKMYKYKGEDGIWHYTNIPPDTQQEVEARQVSVDKPEYRLKVQKRGGKDSPVFYAVNGYYGPVEIEFSLTEEENILSDPVLPARFLIPAFGEKETVRLRPARADRKWYYRYQYRFVFGNPKAVHNPSAPYLPPFEQGKTFVISQAFFGRYSHNLSGSEYAVDIPMPEGTKILAARSGIVMDITNDFFTGGTDLSYGERANMIRILHDDGTMAVYAHLKLESARFPLGTAVSRGDFIAKSGNTGFSTGPHLHFVIQRNRSMDLTSVPFEFETEDGSRITPAEGMLLKSFSEHSRTVERKKSKQERGTGD